RHGFFTRRGGASSGVFKGLNCGFGSTDQTQAVATNRDRVASAMDLDAANLVSVHQYHSSNVLTICEPLPADRPKADAMVSATKGIALGILTADCAPVLFADNRAGIIGAAHAGWKGALNGVIEATLDAMLALGADIGNICAVIGPCISQAAYEVGPEFMDTVMAHGPNYSRFFAGGHDDRLHFDLPAFCLHRLREANVKQAEWIRHCTYNDAARFYSYRRSVHQKEADYGRLISCIRL
ncbi:MAG TPA: peptidoglycan editing factor PgeF, partial [Rhodobacteraceae bacterium]|nr:peptidoglycan editing factor PgeF [Paracoccaceae bacterium]